jgi:hypothetical protein
MPEAESERALAMFEVVLNRRARPNMDFVLVHEKHEPSGDRRQEATANFLDDCRDIALPHLDHRPSSSRLLGCPIRRSKIDEPNRRPANGCNNPTDDRLRVLGDDDHLEVPHSQTLLIRDRLLVGDS